MFFWLPVVPILGYIYWKDNGGKVPSLQGDEIKGGFVLGMMLGQLAFGSLGDALGRRVVYGKESIFTIIGTLLVVLLPWKGLSHNSIVAWLSVFRFITGMGAGGGEHLRTPHHFIPFSLSRKDRKKKKKKR